MGGSNEKLENAPSKKFKKKSGKRRGNKTSKSGGKAK